VAPGVRLSRGPVLGMTPAGK